MEINYDLRGRCKELSEALISKNPDLRLVRGYYFDALWGKQGHWWCQNIHTGEIVDPTKDQFPTRGEGHYLEFDGWFECANCDKKIHEDAAEYLGSYAFCSIRCASRFVGL